MKQLPVSFVETMDVKSWVQCDVYSFENDSEKDLGIIHISPGASTPKQKVLKGNSTIEGYISGKGKIVIEDDSGNTKEYPVGEGKNFSLEIQKGEIVQIIADKNFDLVMYEICYPPYEDGRFLEV